MERLRYILSLSLGFFLCFISFKVQAQIIPDSDAKLRTVKVKKKGSRVAQIKPESDAKLRTVKVKKKGPRIAQMMLESDAKLRTVKVKKKGFGIAKIIPDSDSKLRNVNVRLGPSTRTPEGIKEKVSPAKFDRKERKIWNN